MTEDVDTITAVQSQKAVSAYLTSKQILPSGLAEENSSRMAAKETFNNWNPLLELQDNLTVNMLLKYIGAV